MLVLAEYFSLPEYIATIFGYLNKLLNEMTIITSVSENGETVFKCKCIESFMNWSFATNKTKGYRVHPAILNALHYSL